MPSRARTSAITMPPHPLVYDGIEAIRPLLEQGARRARRLAARPDPREPHAGRGELPPRAGETEFRAFKIDVLRIEDGGIAEITTFDASLFAAFGLRRSLPMDRFERRAVVVAPGEARAFDRGRVARRARHRRARRDRGRARRRRRPGALRARRRAHLDGRDLRALRNPGAGVAALMVVRRVGADGG